MWARHLLPIETKVLKKWDNWSHHIVRLSKTKSLKGQEVQIYQSISQVKSMPNQWHPLSKCIIRDHWYLGCKKINLRVKTPDKMMKTIQIKWTNKIIFQYLQDLQTKRVITWSHQSAHTKQSMVGCISRTMCQLARVVEAGSNIARDRLLYTQASLRTRCTQCSSLIETVTHLETYTATSKGADTTTLQESHNHRVLRTVVWTNKLVS